MGPPLLGATYLAGSPTVFTCSVYNSGLSSKPVTVSLRRAVCCSACACHGVLPCLSAASLQVAGTVHFTQSNSARCCCLQLLLLLVSAVHPQQQQTPPHLLAVACCVASAPAVPPGFCASVQLHGLGGGAEAACRAAVRQVRERSAHKRLGAFRGELVLHRTEPPDQAGAGKD